MTEDSKSPGVYDIVYLFAVIILLIVSIILTFLSPNGLMKFLPIGVPVLLLLTHVQKFPIAQGKLRGLKIISLGWTILLLAYLGACVFSLISHYS